MDASLTEPIAEGSLVADRYEVIRRIGRGGMGSVFAARHTVTDKRVALKVMSLQLSGDPKLVARFLREAKSASTVVHPHAIEVLDVFHHENVPVMVMELLEGRSLADHLEEEAPLGPGELARIVVPVASALAHAHAAGVVHRDVKPENIFLVRREGARDYPKVLDFGIAKMIRDTPGHDTMRLTSTGAMMGTPYYMAPEQAAGRPDTDQRADIWALGVLMYEAVTGELPFRGENFGQVFAQILQDDPPPASSRADVPRAISELIDRCLEKKVARRPSSMMEVSAVLEPFLAHEDAPREVRRASKAQLTTRVSRPTSFAETAPLETGPGAMPRRAEAWGLVAQPTAEAALVPSPAANDAAPSARPAPIDAPADAPRAPRWPLAAGGLALVLVIAAAIALTWSSATPEGADDARAQGATAASPSTGGAGPPSAAEAGDGSSPGEPTTTVAPTSVASSAEDAVATDEVPTVARPGRARGRGRGRPAREATAVGTMPSEPATTMEAAPVGAGTSLIESL